MSTSSLRGSLTMILALMLSLSSGLFCPLAAFSVGISPPRVELAVEPGRLLEGKITVLGRFDQPTRIRVSAGFWHYERDGKIFFATEKGGGDRALASWLTIAPAEFVLNGEAPQIVRYRLKVPPEITGSYWGVLHFRTLAEAVGPSQGAVLVSGGVTTIIIASTKRGAVRDGALTDLAGTWSAEGLALRATFRKPGQPDRQGQGAVQS